MSVVQGLYDVVVGDASLTSKLATYKGAPAVFTFAPAPEDSENPSIVLFAVGGILGTGRDRGHRGGEVTVDVSVYGNKGDSEKTLRDIADELWLLLDRASVQADGFDETVYCLANPPIRAEDPDGFPGFIVSCRVMVRTV